MTFYLIKMCQIPSYKPQMKPICNFTDYFTEIPKQQSLLIILVFFFHKLWYFPSDLSPPIQHAMSTGHARIHAVAIALLHNTSPLSAQLIK